MAWLQCANFQNGFKDVSAMPEGGLDWYSHRNLQANLMSHSVMMRL